MLCGFNNEFIDKENVVMSKKGKIIIALCVLIVGVFFGILIIGAVAYGLYSRTTRGSEMVFAPTEVGAPMGDKVTKNIGPAGGSLTSPDGKLTLIVPQNAVTETVSFSIQPITDTVENGIGNGYRLEPSGKTFTIPIEISIHYNETDLKGTVPQALALAYQDDERAWHSPLQTSLDPEKKTLTASTTHFSNWIYLSLLKITPLDATVYVGETQFIKIALACPPTKLFDWFAGFDCSDAVYTKDAKWELRGEGTLTRFDNSSGVVYTAPPKKPAKNHVFVELSIVIISRNRFTGELSKDPKTFGTEITIVDRGYRASGKGGTTVVSGDICDIEKPFTLKTNNPFVPSLEFEPDPVSPTKGTFTFTTSDGLSGSCECKYTITGTDSTKTAIELTGSSTGSLGGVTGSGGEPMHIDLVPLEKCGK